MDKAISEAIEMDGFAKVMAIVGECNHEAGVESLDLFLKRVPESAGGKARALCKRESKYRRPAARYFKELGISIGYADRTCIHKLESCEGIESVLSGGPLSVIQPTARRAVHHRATTTWGLMRLQVRKLWDKGLTGQGVTIGVLDSGIDSSHPALSSRIALSEEFDDQGHRVPNSLVEDHTGHGTHTAGILCGGETQRRAIGVAPGAKILVGKVMRGNFVEVEAVVAGLEWLLSNRVQIVNLSFGFRSLNTSMRPLVHRLRLKEIFPVFAIGNDGVGRTHSPGNFPEALSVGAIGRSNDVPSFSGSQHFNRMRDPVQPDLVAPGVSVISARPGGGFESRDGTSMAAPHVAGIAALLLEAVPSATLDQLEQALLSTCFNLPSEVPSRIGHGLVNPLAALSALRELQ